LIEQLIDGRRAWLIWRRGHVRASGFSSSALAHTRDQESHLYKQIKRVPTPAEPTGAARVISAHMEKWDHNRCGCPV
jgi:hypothetical protein